MISFMTNHDLIPTVITFDLKEKILDTVICENEKEMFLYFINKIRDLDPDLIVGWNSNNFDLPYLFNRCKKLGIDKQFKTISPMNWCISDKNDFKVKGRVCFDLLKGYKILTAGEKVSYRLNSISKLELGEEKVKLPINMSFEELNKQNKPKLVEYSRQDTLLLKLLNEEKGIIDYFDTLRREIGCNWEDLQYNTRIADVLLIRKLDKKFILPTTIPHKRKDLKGGLVLTPKPGLHKNVGVLDLKSLYPSIIISYNMSPETINKEGKIDVGNGIKFKSKEECKGLIPDILIELFKLRKHYKSLMKQYPYSTSLYNKYYNQQYAIKIILNSFYGVLGSPHYRLYREEIAGSVTYIGRKIINWTKEEVNKKGMDVIYADTDSNFIKVEGENAVERLKEICSYINFIYKDFAQQHNILVHNFEMEFEKLFSKVFFGESKKRYAGLVNYLDGEILNPEKLVIVGFEVIRSDSSYIAQKIQKKLFRMVLEEKNKSDIDEFIKTEKKKLIEGFYTFDDIGIPKAITKPLNTYKSNVPHVRGAKYSNKYLKTQFKEGNKVKFIFIYPYYDKGIGTDVISFEFSWQLPKNIKVDWSKMMPSTIDNKVERIYSALGWNYSFGVKSISSKLFITNSKNLESEYNWIEKEENKIIKEDLFEY